MTTLLIIYCVTYPICVIIVAGLCFAHFQGDFPFLAKDEKREDLGFAVVMGLSYGAFSLLGVFLALCMSGFAKHGWRLK